MSEAPAPSGPTAEVRLGSYRLLEPLGSGGMSSVFRAVHEGSGAEVAVKVLPRYLAKNPVLLQRFLREAQSAEALDHPNIVSIFDHGTEDGRYYLVLEYVRGLDLHDHVKRVGPLSLKLAVEVAEQAVEALEYATSKGLIHRDIKPANLLLGERDRLKVIDLGLALQREAEDERVTRDGTTVGTVDYMAPEQARDSRGATALSDQYSLGCTLYYLLTGLPPFPGGDIADKLRRHALSPAPDIRAHRSDAPPELAELIRRMMAKNPADRFPDLGALRAGIQALPASARVDDEPGLDFALLADEEEADFALGPARAAVADVVTMMAAPAASDFKETSAEELRRLLAGEAEAGRDVDRPALLDGDAVVASDAAQPAGPTAFSDDEGRLDSIDRPGRGVGGIPVREAGAVRESRGSPQAWAIGGAAIGLVGALFLVGAITLSRALGPVPAEPLVESSPRFDRVPAARPARSPDLEPIARASLTPTVDGRGAPSAEPEPALDAEPRFSPEEEAAFAPRPGPVAPVLESLVTVADRLDDAALVRALESTEGTIEPRDVGPYFADEIKVRGQVRAWCAPEGRRAMLAILRPSDLDATAPIVVEAGVHLTIERFDLIADPSTWHASEQMALFECRAGASLTLRECTVTLVGSGQRPSRRFPLVRFTGAAEGDVATIRLDRTLIRGATGPLIIGGPAAIGVDAQYSALLATSGSVVEANGLSDLCFRRTFLASAGAVFTAGPRGSAEVRALGCQFAELGGEGRFGVSEARGPWRGLGNRYRGFEGIPEGEEAAEFDPSVAPGSELNRLLSTPAELQAGWPRFATTLAHVAGPTPYLLARTLGGFERARLGALDEPRQVGRTTSSAGMSGIQGPIRGSGAGLDEGGINPQRASQGREPARSDSIVFDLDDSANDGDLAAFVEAAALRSAEPVLRIEVRGRGSLMRRLDVRPIRLVGRSLELRIAAALRGSLEFRGVPAEEGALIEVTAGDLSLDGFTLNCVGPAIRVRGGCLRMTGCWVIGEGAGTLIEHQNEAVEASRPQVSLADCLIIAASDGIRATVSSGVVRLDNVALAAGATAITLVHEPSSGRNVFRGELWLDRVSMAAERTLVRLAPWSGEAGARPDRPWVVFSRGSYFVDDYAGRTSAAPMLACDGESWRLGSIAWQGERDVYDLGRFITLDDEDDAPRAKADFRRDWRRVWGEDHVIESIGPSARAGGARKSQRLTPGAVKPEQIIGAARAAGRDAGVAADRFGPSATP